MLRLMDKLVPRLGATEVVFAGGVGGEVWMVTDPVRFVNVEL